jgi:putative ABC transport system permease protein
MNIRLALSLAMSSLWYRRKVLALVTLTLTLSITLLLGVQYLRTEVKQTFTNTISGTDLIVGARSGQLNLLLYTIFHIGDATNNIRWTTYQQLQDDQRIDWLVPVSLGDSYRGHRVVGTSEQFPEHFRYGRDQKPELLEGEWFSDVFNVVLGARVAREYGHQPGDAITLSHGGGRTSFSNHKDTPFTVTGILAPTGTPIDQAICQPGRTGSYPYRLGIGHRHPRPHSNPGTGPGAGPDTRQHHRRTGRDRAQGADLPGSARNQRVPE